MAYRFLTHPEFAPLYLGDLRRQATTVFASENLNPLLDRVLGEWVPATELQAMKNFVAARNAFVLSQIPTNLTAWTYLPMATGYNLYRTADARTVLRGAADPVRTRRVLVNGQEAQWEALTGQWEASDIRLDPGVNNLSVVALDAGGGEVQRLLFPVWYDAGSTVEVGGALSTHTWWSATNGPYRVTQMLEVPAGVTLTIEAGTSVYFEPNGGLVIHGRLLAVGTANRPVYFDRPPGGSGSWAGLFFDKSTNENRLVCLYMANYAPHALVLSNSVLVAEHVIWTNSIHNVIIAMDSSLAVRFSRFPDIAWEETVGGVGIMPNGFMVFEGNTFGTTLGYADIVDFTGGKRPGPIIQFRNNVFLGGSDDGLDLDGTDAHIEGNVFMHFHKYNSSTSESSAIATGGYLGDYSNLVVTRNIFFDNDYDLVLKEGAVVHAQNNTFVASVKGSLCFAEPDRPGAAPARAVWLDGDIFWHHPVVMANLDTNLLTQGALEVRVDHSILPQPGPWSGVGNSDEDPRFVNPTNDFHLRAGSPALGSGPFGLDMGALVSAGARVTGEPSPLTARREATLTVDGPGLTHYRYRVNGGAWSQEMPVTQLLVLTNLADGPYQVAVIGRNSAGVWSAESEATLSRSWTVSRSAPRVWLSEVLARNTAAVFVSGAYPDLVELYNDSPDLADLSDLSLTDDPAVPRKFTFPANTRVAPDSYLVLIADRATNVSGLHLGFALDDKGEEITLFDRVANGGQKLDSVTFGVQVADLSIARLDNGEWTLAEPTFGGPNRPARLGDASRIRINEWLANPGAVFRDDFIELFNPDSLPVAMGGFHLTDSPAGWPDRQALPPLSFIPAQGYAVFYADGDTAAGGGHLGFGLAFEQGMIGLFDAAGAMVDQVSYGPQQPDVSEGRHPSGSPDIGFFPFPTPGAAPGPTNPPTGVVVLNEVMVHGIDWTLGGQPRPGWLELYNAGTPAMDLGGLSLSDRLDAPRRWILPAGTIIGSHGFLLVKFDSLTPVSADNTGFDLSAKGDSVYLFDRPESGGGVLDSVTFGVQAVNFSLGRIPSGTGGWRLNTPTPAAPNLAAALGDPAHLRINEWMAAPPTGNDWFELYNPDARPVELSGLQFTDELANPAKSPVPPLSYLGVGLGAYQVFVADRQPGQGADHVDFQLSTGGEAIGLASASGVLFESVIYGAQEAGVSEGRLPDGASRIVRFPNSSTPGRPNTDPLSPRLGAVLLAGDQVQLEWDSKFGLRYEVERTSHLTPAEWSLLGTVTAAGDKARYVDQNLGGAGAFYRLRIVP